MPLKLFVFMLCLSVNLFSQDVDSLALPEKAQLGFIDKHTDWVMDVPQAALPPLHYFKDHQGAVSLGSCGARSYSGDFA